MKRYRIMTSMVLLLLSVSLLSAMTAEEIMRKADELQTFDSSYSTGEFRISDRFGTKVTTFNAWSRGAEESLIEFTSVAERGQKVLRTDDSIYLYYPDAEELIRMQGSALRQGMLGSDISYEDMTGGKDRLSQYDIVLSGEEALLGRDCYVLTLTAKTRSVPYPKEIVWISKDNYLVMKGEYYTKSGRLLKELEVLETGTFDGLEVAVETRISDKMKTDTETIMVLESLDLDARVDDDIFSLEELSW